MNLRYLPKTYDAFRRRFCPLHRPGPLYLKLERDFRALMIGLSAGRLSSSCLVALYFFHDALTR